MMKTLKYMPYAQAHVIIDDNNNIALISYTTTVCVIDRDGFLECTGTYSNTTRRHIGNFLKEYAPNNITYYTAKAAFEGNYKINIYTGEVIDLP